MTEYDKLLDKQGGFLCTKAPRGTFDILPEEHAYWKYVQEKAVFLCQLYGYQPLSTPIFEDAQLFTQTVAGGTDIVDKEMYIFRGQKWTRAGSKGRGDSTSLPGLPGARTI
jgi:ATP phosphoribosyltransferase regulatory subunit HisZ